MENHFGHFGHRANLDARYVHGLRRTYYRLGNRFGRTQWNPYVMWVMSNLVSVRLEMVLVSVQDSCMVCAKRTIGSRIILEETYGTSR